MSRLFETVIVEEDCPKFLVVGESAICDLLVENLLSGGAQVFFLKNGQFPNKPDLYKISARQIQNISQKISHVFFEKEPEEKVEEELKTHLGQARFMYLNPRELKKNAVMFFAPFIYGPKIFDKSFGFLALNEKSVQEEKTLVFPENLEEEVRPILSSDLVGIIEKVMFSGGNGELYLLLGAETVSIVTFLGALKGRLKFEVQSRYLEERLSFHIPNAGQIELGATPLEKGIKETADWLNLGIKPKEIPIIPDVPKHIPAIENLAKDEVDFHLDNNFIKRIYHDNLTYLKEEELYKSQRKSVERIKVGEHAFALSFNLKKKRFFDLLARLAGAAKKIIAALKNPFRAASIFKQKAVGFSLKIISVVVSVVFILSLPWVFYVITLIISLSLLQNSAALMLKYDYLKSAKYANFGEKSLTSARAVHRNILKYYYLAAGQKPAYRTEENFFDLAETGFKILKSGENSVENISRALPLVLNTGKGEGVEGYLVNAAVSARDARDTFSSHVARLKHDVPALPWFLRFKQDEYYSFLRQTPVIYQNLNKTNLFLQALPDILGKNSKKTYAILFQNNMELRSTGGFIGSYALISFEKEKLLGFSVMDVYDADGQLKGKVEPPPEILHFLGQPDWFLRDSNVSPNFPTAASRASWFIGKETGVALDGVFAIDISLMEDVLKVLGPIHLSDFNVTVSSGNLFEKTEKAAEKDFFPGSTKKKDFLKSLGETIWANVLNLKDGKIFDLMRVGMDAGATRHFQAYFEDRDAQKIAEFLKIDGVLLKTNGAYLNIIENNYGANKVNYFVKREINHQIKLLSDGFVEHTINVKYNNQSPMAAWPAGDYRTYVKFYVPKNSIFKDFKYEGKTPKLSEALNENILEKIKTDSEQLVLSGEEEDLRYFASFIDVPVGAAREISFSWQSENSNPKNLQKFDYYFQKQAGIVKDPYRLTILFPEALHPSSNIAPSLVSKGKVEYNLDTEKDIDLNIKFD